MSLRRTVLRVEVLYDDSSYVPDLGSLAQVADFIVTGDGSGQVTIESDEELTRNEMKEALIAQGSDPEFLLGEEEEKEEESE